MAYYSDSDNDKDNEITFGENEDVPTNLVKSENEDVQTNLVKSVGFTTTTAPPVDSTRGFRNSMSSAGGSTSSGYVSAGTKFMKQARKDKKHERDLRLKWKKYHSERTGLSSFQSSGELEEYGSIVNAHSDTEIDAPSIDKKSYPYYPITSGSIRLPDDFGEIELEPKDVLMGMVFGSKMNILLLFMPFALASHFLNWSPVSIFVFNFLTMIPLAALLGDFTEEVAAHTNQTIGGLINASFGNAVEVVVAIEALLAGEYRVVQASMIGSIFSNLLLVLGCCFLFGGMYHSEQSYNPVAATANMGLLGLSCIALVLPTPFAEYYDIKDEEALMISRIAALFLIFMYAQLLLFQLKTHADLLGQEEDEKKTLPMSVAICALVAITAIIAFLSNSLVASIDGFCAESGISKTFTGLIILPIVGNAVEHMTAISVAMKDKMDLAMGVAVGSATQISLFVSPLIVIVGWIANRPMTLNFPPFEIFLFILSVIVVSIILSYPKSNWLEGSMLVTTYMLIAVGFWFEKVVDYS